MVMQTFGNMLLYPESDCVKEFPSPEELKHRIVISAKPPKQYLEDKQSSSRGSNSNKEIDSDEGDLTNDDDKVAQTGKKEKKKLTIFSRPQFFPQVLKGFCPVFNFRVTAILLPVNKVNVMVVTMKQVQPHSSTRI